MSYITPPVALASITAADVAHSNAWATSLSAMRLGSVLFVLPFMFVVNPALIMQGEWTVIAQASVTAIVAMWMIAAAFEGYLYKVGVVEFPVRALLLAAGGCLVFPGPITDVIGIALVAVAYLVASFVPGMAKKLY